MDQSHQSLRTVILHACRGFSERLIATPHDQVIIAINGGSSHGLAWLVGVRVTSSSVLAAATGAEKATWVLVFWVCVFAFYFYLACRSFLFLFYFFPFPSFLLRISSAHLSFSFSLSVLLCFSVLFRYSRAEGSVQVPE